MLRKNTTIKTCNRANFQYYQLMKKNCVASEKIIIPIIYLASLLLPFSTSLNGQDLHFSQYWNTPLDLNPALAGVAGEDVRIMTAYKRQWASVPVDYTTFYGAVDSKWNPFGSGGNFFGWGLLLNHDQAGDGDWTLNNLMGQFAYTHQLKKGVYATIGTQMGFGERSFNLSGLTFDNQYNGDVFDPTRGTGERFSDTRTRYWDFGAGFNIHLQKADQRSKLDIGFGLHHLNTPSENFYFGSSIDIPVRKDFYAVGFLKITEKLDLMANGLIRFQNEYEEVILGGGIRFHLNTQIARELALDLGGSLRTGDAFLPYIGLLYHQWRFGFVYDINTSPFSSATNNNGGPEISVVYTITKPKPPAKKLCPLF